MNKVTLMGRLTKDPELKSTTTGVSVCSFSIAVNRRFVKAGEERQADFINCVAWRQTAEFICKYFAKGRMIAVAGSIQTRNWEDKEGKRQYATEVVVEDAYFADSAPAGSNTGAPRSQWSDPPVSQAAATFDALPEPGDFMPGGLDDDLPF